MFGGEVVDGEEEVVGDEVLDGLEEVDVFELLGCGGVADVGW